MIAQTTPRPATPRQSQPAARPVAARMADFIAHHQASAGSVTREDLLLEFSEEQIDGHFEAAKAICRKNGKNGKARQ